jgi:proline dehydrogenase
MLRSLFLFLSGRRRLRRWADASPLAALLAKRFIAGRTLDDAAAACHVLNARGFTTALNHLGEAVSTPEEARLSRDGVDAALCRIAEEHLQSSVSVKLTHLGLDVSEALCRENICELMETVRTQGGFLEVDMESSGYVDRTLRIVVESHARYGRVRAVVQACLRRTGEDVDALCRSGIPVRLCKGAYRENSAVAYRKKAEVDEHYRLLAESLLDRGAFPAFAIHDLRLIQHVKECVRRKGSAAGSFEFQMLHGIRRDLQQKLVEEGYRLRIYLPYGASAYSYFMRRLAEKPSVLLLLARNLRAEASEGRR